MDFNLKKHIKKTPAASANRERRHPDPAAIQTQTPPPLPSPSRLKLLHRVLASSKPCDPQPKPPAACPRAGARLQGKAMSASAMAKPSDALVAKPARLHATFVAEKPVASDEKDSREEKTRKSWSGAAREKEKKALSAWFEIGSPLASLGAGGKRRSVGGPAVELGSFLTCNGAKVVAVDMLPRMQMHAVECARRTRDSLEKFTSRALAQALKKEFDGVYGPAWHCIVGTSFGSFVTHSVGGFLYFAMDEKLYVLLFKTAVQRTD